MGAGPGQLALTCLRPAAPAVFTLKEKRSEFIAALHPANTTADARSAFDLIRAEHRQATHNCPAWRVGFPEAEEFASDDGEPSGTAGRPILGELQKAGLCNAVLVVTRYFGGVKLGVRGLIDAYSAAAAGVIERAQTETVRPFLPLRLNCSYESLASLNRLLRSSGVDENRVRAEYGGTITLNALVELSLAPLLRERLSGYESRALMLDPPQWGSETILAADV